ncbi:MULTISPECIES: hypothetical protein [unclassified Microcoleus]|uniref:hypothetical protein n=1 Tax=unclassified Microcoleus TaxID=2642155 RepID=UPI001D9025C4|nr:MULTISPECIES: hypothetical protein [unclassified Microcoleus]MCC3413988.1 hypothetical protein [Microcoleus sp. PH2017_02_FOX_O_A]MCC3475115.1 hypothetical protein [Microcoleus sp. PH2017_13_LAR_U_A]MCC3486377.1 hypothetical protein [Microcoleus sp. PH2017_14_LAR_D_A]MCC3492003.1 hypothetical protein [Microcoleus sp. PH2017_16_JOR_D_A]MCC3517106.1 hypothetical protein [Microcoleus sp. PH2017_18_LLB_O_A]
MLNFQRQATLAVSGTADRTYPDRKSPATPLQKKLSSKLVKISTFTQQPCNTKNYR